MAQGAKKSSGSKVTPEEFAEFLQKLLGDEGRGHEHKIRVHIACPEMAGQVVNLLFTTPETISVIPGRYKGQKVSIVCIGRAHDDQTPEGMDCLSPIAILVDPTDPDMVNGLTPDAEGLSKPEVPEGKPLSTGLYL